MSMPALLLLNSQKSKRKLMKKQYDSLNSNLVQIGHYLQKISESLYKECGERPHSFRLGDNESNFLQENFQTDDSTLLKRCAEKMQEKMEVIGLNILNYMKFKSETDDRVTKLEKMIPKCFTTDQFREES